MINDELKIHEELFFDTFINKDKKKRLKNLLKSKKGRKKIRESLPHSLIFNPAFIKNIPANQQTKKNITKLLITKNAPPTCYLISEHTSLDRKTMNLEDAINTIVGSGISTIISCIPGKLAYYEGEDLNDRFILEK